MLSTVFWDNRDNLRALFPFTALTSRFFAGFVDFLARLRNGLVDNIVVERSFATLRKILFKAVVYRGVIWGKVV
ncbi:hypothetical protein [Musicola keenii]|uniref:hypothetical protein n=1 Tax=Musicola keenii TaxID=2884250 RepID=UPI00177AC29C|nr:hypothetical protein [Musicola keenii]